MKRFPTFAAFCHPAKGVCRKKCFLCASVKILGACVVKLLRENTHPKRHKDRTEAQSLNFPTELLKKAGCEEEP